MRYQLLTAVFLSFILISCGETTFDASSEKTIKASVTLLKKGKPEEETKKLQDSMMIVAMQDFNIKDAMQGKESKVPVIERMKHLDGLTNKQILANADEIRVKREMENQ